MPTPLFYRGQVFPKREVPCVEGCGTTLLRARRHDQATCMRCARRKGRECEARYKAKLREQARRYRVLMAISPYKTFNELYDALSVRKRRKGEGQ